MLLPGGSSAQRPVPATIHLIYMGGNDCPPCVAWRRTELPKLQQTEVFKTVTFVYAEKLIRSTVPPRLFLPEAAKPFKDKLDHASGGVIGSPQVAVLVDGEVVDYYLTSRSAADVEKMLLALRGQRAYPFQRCLRRADRQRCAEPA